MSKQKHEKKRSKSRRIGYHYEGTFDESEMERLLSKWTKAGIVVEYDTGRGSIVWFNGYPGEELRSIRNEVEAILAEGGEYRQVTHSEFP